MEIIEARRDWLHLLLTEKVERLTFAPRQTTLTACDMDDIPTLRCILTTKRVIAIFGLPANWYRPSYFAAI